MMLTEQMIITEDGSITNDLGEKIDFNILVEKIKERDNWIIFISSDLRFKCLIDDQYYNIKLPATVLNKYSNLNDKDNVELRKNLDMLFNMADCFKNIRMKEEENELLEHYKKVKVSEYRGLLIYDNEVKEEYKNTKASLVKGISVKLLSALVVLGYFPFMFINKNHDLSLLASFLFGGSGVILGPSTLKKKVKEYIMAYDRLGILKGKIAYIEENQNSIVKK